ncbi:unnamed protein product [Menidia menidia]|uniref:(Atlantic silverside) hypothetical protein n=1 Tax=Menidia menidia TaxID=238744 RepID=A0A8S4B6V3_9TELE|nr:unnamed protein product [Menidia menidia]
MGEVPVSDHGVLVMELNSGLSFPASEHLSHIIHTQALQASPPRSVVLDCRHVSVLDYSLVGALRDLLRQFRLRKPAVLRVLAAADLQGLRLTDSLEEALQLDSEIPPDG